MFTSDSICGPWRSISSSSGSPSCGASAGGLCSWSPGWRLERCAQEKPPSAGPGRTSPGSDQPGRPPSLAARQKNRNPPSDARPSVELVGIPTHVVKGGAVVEHEQDVVDELLHREVGQRVAPVQFPADHRQVDGPLDDLVVVLGLRGTHSHGSGSLEPGPCAC